MSINTLEFAQNMTKELDKAAGQKTVTGFLADNSLRARFVGANKVLIPEVEISGLGDYDRDTGFVTGTITVSSTPYTLTMDRGRSFQLDREDNDETGIANLAGQVMGEFVRTRVVPEVDGNAHAAHKVQRVRLVIVGARKLESFFIKNLRQREHAGPADTNEMNPGNMVQGVFVELCHTVRSLVVFLLTLSFLLYCFLKGK